jgi:hypothetical protein
MTTPKRSLLKNRFLPALLGALALVACGSGKAGVGTPPEGPPGQPGPAVQDTATPYSGAPADVSAEAPAPPAQPSAEEGMDFDAAESSDAASGAPAPAPRMQRGEAERSAARKARPGLGTVWGETRVSRIQHTTFQRAEPETPFASASLFYNDRQGVKSMARQSALSNHGDGGFSTLKGAVSVRLLDEHGRPLPAFEVASRNYVMGEHGDRYLIEIKNRTGERLEAVATVDGLDVVDGRPGSIEKRGYVIRPFDTLQIDGFRQSTDTVAAFRFGSVRDSYASKKGKGRNVGVIGVAIFHERGSDLPWTFDEIEHRHTADPFPGRFASPPR